MALLRTFQERQIQLWVLITLLMTALFVNEYHHEQTAYPPVLSVANAPALQGETKSQGNTAADAFEKVLSKEKAGSVLPFSEITEFQEKNSTQEAYIDLLKRRYEAWLITYYYLQKCSQAGPADLAVIHASLQKELASAQAKSTDESNILLAANGSYTEMYSDIPCDNAHIAATKASYDANMQQAKVHTVSAASPASPH